MMHLLSFATLLLATTVTASSDCTLDGGRPGWPEDPKNQVLQLVNQLREKLASGKQGNGNTGAYLPKAKKIDPLIWDCDLEQDATTTLSSCPIGNFLPREDKASFYIAAKGFPTQSNYISTLLVNGTHYIDDDSFKESAFRERELVYSPTTGSLRIYANLMRDTTTKIGCFSNWCGNTDSAAVYCLTDQPELMEDTDVIYEFAQTTTSATSTAATTTTTAAATTTTTAAPTTTTTAAATARVPSEGATTSSGATTIAYATGTTPASTSTVAEESAATATKGTTSCIPRRKVATTTSLAGLQQQAVFPPSTSGSNDICPGNSRMHDELRLKFLDMHNYHRAELARGNVAKRNGNYLPQSSDMQKMRYDCALENDSVDYLSSCPSSKSAEFTRPDVGENFIRVPEEATYLTAAQKAVTSWWKVIGSEEGPGLQVYFRQKHLGSPIESFTQMGWSTSRKLGCAVAKCGNDHVAACRYFPKGNHVEQVIYKRGTPCTACAAGSWCTEDVLCTLS